MNTMSAHVNAGVLQALEMCADDKTVRVVVFTGTGDRAFCAGGNLEGGGASSGFRGQAYVSLSLSYSHTHTHTDIYE